MRVPLKWLAEYVKLPKETKILTDKLTMAGHMLDKVDSVGGNVVIDLELRGNRADCYSILGIAREVSALFKTPIKYPEIKTKIKKVKALKEVTLDIQTPLVKRVMTTVVRDVVITKSPKWLAEKLEEYGMPTINNIVDLTNFVMIETGEPMHAFDLDKISTGLQIRLAKKSEKILTFLGKEITLTGEDLVWSNKSNILSIAGAIGEKNRSISETTQNILLEAASYDRANVRRTIHKHSLFTDAGIRHEKDLDPNLVEFAIQRFLKLIEENKWGTVTGVVSDYYPKPIKPWPLSLNFNFLKSLSGLEISKAQVQEIVKGLGFEITGKTDTHLELSAPTYRTDVVQDEDLVEEVLRILGYDKIPTRTLSLEVPDIITPDYINQEVEIKNGLVGLGINEVISLPFVKTKLLELNQPLGQTNAAPVTLANRPSPDLEVLRMSLLPSLFELAQKVQNERGESVRFFEIGKVYAKIGREYQEKRKLAIIYWSNEENDFYHFKGLLDSSLEKIGLTNLQFDNAAEAKNLINQYKIILAKKTIGYGGTYQDCHYVEIDLDSILGKTNLVSVKLWPKYPPQVEDITLILPERTKVGDIIQEATKISNVAGIELKDIYQNAYTLHILYQNPSHTLNNDEVEKIRTKILNLVSTKFGGTLKV